jgi:hypothetical protein
MAKKEPGKLHSSGEITPKSGQYEIVGPRGGDRGGNEITGVKGKPLPPVPEPGLKLKLADETKHKGK